MISFKYFKSWQFESNGILYSVIHWIFIIFSEFRLLYFFSDLKDGNHLFDLKKNDCQCLGIKQGNGMTSLLNLTIPLSWNHFALLVYSVLPRDRALGRESWFCLKRKISEEKVPSVCEISRNGYVNLSVQIIASIC